jgi:Glycosyl hydrolase family 20, domain 2/Glycosyl hydrolase family 20, catalytic domain
MKAFLIRFAVGWLLLLWAGVPALCQPLSPPRIFPDPREATWSKESFLLDANVLILVPEKPSPEDLRLARFLVAELSDQHGVALRVRQAAALPGTGRFILMGSAANLLIRQFLSRRGHQKQVKEPEGYWLEVTSRSVVVAGADDRGAFYGLQSLRQLIRGGTEGKERVPGVTLRDWPLKPFRGIKVYLPSRENIPYFKRFVRNVMALYKFNELILEMDGAMRLDRHPEINAGWLEFGRNMNSTRRERSWGTRHEFQDSANADVAGGEVLEKQEVAELLDYVRSFHVDVIPEIPSLTHSYYLLTRRRDLAEIPNAEWPDAYCPLAPGIYRLLFEVLDEYLEVMKPGTLLIGHDEWRVPVGVCPRCKGHSPTELYAQDVDKIHAYLRRKGVRTAIYGDHLIEALRGKQVEEISGYKGFHYETPGGLSDDQVRRLIPKDILVFNWFWHDGDKGQGEQDDLLLEKWGFEQVYGNMEPDIQNFARRAARRGILGGAPSAWAATTELNLGKDLMFDILGCARLLWSGEGPSQAELSETAQRLLPGIAENVSPPPFPSEFDPVEPVDIEPALNAASVPGVDLTAMPTGRVAADKVVFDLERRDGKCVVAVSTGGPASSAIAVGADVSSVIFLQALTKPARNVPAYQATWNYQDTADLVGWYEVTYVDGFVQTVPIRYGVNILEVGWGESHQPGNLAYDARLVDCGGTNSKRLTFFADEWRNPRPGIPVKEIRLRATAEIRNAVGETSSPNTLMLAAVSVVKKLPAAGPALYQRD